MSLDQFLQVIHDDPNDYVARLVFADWLEEQGDPRAELFRLHYELAALPPETPRRATLQARLSELLRYYRTACYGSPPSWWKVQLERGFLTVSTTAVEVLNMGTAWWAEQEGWVARLRLTDCDDHSLSVLTERRLLDKVPVLDVSATHVTNAGMTALGQLSDLRKLELHDTRVGTPGVRALAGMKGLHELQLDGTPISNAGLEFLPPELRGLHLGFTWAVTNAGLPALSRLPHLQVLTLPCSAVTNAGLEALGRLTSLRVLSLSDTQITDAGLRELMGLRNLSALWLFNTRVSEEGVAALQEALPRCTIYSRAFISMG